MEPEGGQFHTFGFKMRSKSISIALGNEQVQAAAKMEWNNVWAVTAQYTSLGGERLCACPSPWEAECLDLPQKLWRPDTSYARLPFCPWVEMARQSQI